MIVSLGGTGVNFEKKWESSELWERLLFAKTGYPGACVRFEGGI